MSDRNSVTITNMMEILNPSRSKTKLDTLEKDNENTSKRKLPDDSFEASACTKTPKISKNSDVTWLASPREARRLRSDLLEARSQIANLENRIQHMHGIRKEMQVMFENETKALKQQKEYDRKTIADLENQVQTIRKREADVKSELVQLKNRQTSEKLTFEIRIADLEQQLTKITSQLKFSESTENDEIIVLKRRVSELEVMLDAAQKDAESQKNLASELNAHLSEVSLMEKDLEMKEQALLKAHMKIKDLEFAKEAYNDWQQQVKIHQHRLATYPDLEKEVQKLKKETKQLRDEVYNKLLLEEQVADLKEMVEKYKAMEQKYSEVQVAYAQSEMLVGEWRSVARGLCEVTGEDAALPRQMRRCVERLQQEELTLVSQKVELEYKLKNALHEAKTAVLDSEKSQKQIRDLQTSQQQHQALIHRLQKKLMLVSRERDSYRLQLDSYEKDLTMSITPSAQSGQAQFAVQRDRIENLERLNEEYRDLVSKLEADLQALQPHISTENVAPIRAEQMSRLQAEVDRLQQENEKLTEQCDNLQIQLENSITGRDDVGDNKVIHFRNNPAAECMAQNEADVKKLQDEVDRLKRKIRNMEQGLETSASTSICSTQEVQELREQLKTAEAKMQRLKDFFKSSSLEFRNVCYMLLGYKIDRMSNSQYKLSSMYAESPDDYLCFQLNSDGNLNLLETEFSSTLDSMIELHLRHQGSIPTFLSSITLDLFTRTTVPTKTMSVELD